MNRSRSRLDQPSPVQIPTKARAPGRTRTFDLRIRNPLLYPAELRAQILGKMAHRERVSNGNGEVSAKMTFGEVTTTHLRNLDDNLSIKPRTRDYLRECLDALQKSWSGLSEAEVRKITQTDCREWARAYRKAVSPTRYNNTVSVRRNFRTHQTGGVFARGVCSGVRSPPKLGVPASVWRQGGGAYRFGPYSHSRLRIGARPVECCALQSQTA